MRAVLDGPRITWRAPYSLRVACRGIPGSRWNPAKREWFAPATPAVARAVVETFSATAVAVDADVAALAAKANAVQRCLAMPVSALPTYRTQHPPRTYQRRAYAMMREARAVLLAWEMGTGKTKAVVDFVANEAPRRVLVVAPKTAMPVWELEYAKHAPEPRQRKVVLLSGPCRKRLEAMRRYWAMPKPPILVTNYEAFARAPLSTEFPSMDADMVVLDECHRIKAPGGKVSRVFAAASPRQYLRVGLSGTPLPHSPLDAYALCRWLDCGLFGTSFTRFKQRYAVTVPLGMRGVDKVVGFQNLDELRARLGEITYRIRQDEVAELPPTQHQVIPVILSAEARRTYEVLERTLVVAIGDGVVTASNALVRLLRLQQVTSGFLTPDGEDRCVEVDTAKRDALADLLTDLPPDEHVVVFCRFRRDLDAVHEVAQKVGRRSCELSGRRHDIRGRWVEDGTTVAAIQMQSGALGIDLTLARYCVFYSLGFSLGDYMQACKRVHRHGQTRRVVYYHLVAAGTVDEVVLEALQAKQEVVEAVVENLRAKRLQSTRR